MSEYAERFDMAFREERTSIEHEGCDRTLLLSVILLLLFGVLMVYSATAVVTPGGGNAVRRGKEASQFYFLIRHLFSLMGGAVFMFIAYKVNLRRLYAASLPLLILSAVTVTLVFVPGIGLTINGASRWIRFWPSTFQPSEFAKFALIIFLSRYLSSPRFNPGGLTSFVKPLLVMGIFQGLFLLQPDFGAAMTTALIVFTLLFLAGVRIRFLVGTLLLMAPIVIKLVMVPYRLKRISAFLDPWSDQQGSGYQLVQSFIALGSGGLTGTGLGESKQKLAFLPYINTDFIFSLMGEELGFAGVSVAILLFGVVFVRGMKIASKKEESFHYFLGHGLTYLIIYQMLMNIAVVIGLLPTKGLPLPFVSYGGSALFVNMTAVGLLLNLSKRHQPISERNPANDLLRRRKARISIYGRGTRAREVP